MTTMKGLGKLKKHRWHQTGMKEALSFRGDVTDIGTDQMLIDPSAITLRR